MLRTLINRLTGSQERCDNEIIDILTEACDHRCALQTMTERLVFDVHKDLNEGRADAALERINAYPSGYEYIYEQHTGKDYPGLKYSKLPNIFESPGS